MSKAEFQLRGISDPRLAVHATSSLPAWLWSIDGTRILWANPVGAPRFNARNGAELVRSFGPADPHRRQVMQLAGRLLPNGAIRLERLRGFGAPLGSLITCACSRLDFSDGGAGVLLVSTTPPIPVMPLVERLQRLMDGIDRPAAVFARDGTFLGANDTANALLGFRNLSGEGLEAARNAALQQGRAETETDMGTLVLHRLGVGADTGLIALIEPFPATSPAAAEQEVVAGEPAPVREEAPNMPIPDYEAAASSGEAPSEFTLVDEFAEPPATPAEATTLPAEGSEHEPSALVEAVADEPPAASVAEPLGAPHAAEPGVATMPPWSSEPPQPRHTALRFVWQMDADGRFWLGSDEFIHLIGRRSAAALGRPWRVVADKLGMDPDGQVERAIATHDTWSGVTLSWPVDGGARLAVELSGLPIYDDARHFAGYRGFGICRDLEELSRLASMRHAECSAAPPAPQALSSDTARRLGLVAEVSESTQPAREPIAHEPSNPPDRDRSLDSPKNVLPFRPASEARLPSLTPVENNAFDELARQLATRLEAEKIAVARASDAPVSDPDTVAEAASGLDRTRQHAQPQWLSPAEPPAGGEMLRDKPLLELLPVGVLIYRLDRLLYANRAFLDRIGYASLGALEEADGLDALFVEPLGAEDTKEWGSSTSDNGTAVTIAASPASSDHAPLPPTEARLFTITWNGESALALICSNSRVEPAASAAPAPAAEPSPVGQANAEELGAILDTMAEGVVMFDEQGRISTCNRSAEALFGYDGGDFTRRNLTDLFAPESQRVLKDYLENIKRAGVSSLLDQGRDVVGRVRGGGLVPLSMTMGRTRPDGPNFFAAFRDLSQVKKNEADLLQARRQAERAAHAKADVLARISHEVRTPLNAIIGFAEVMIGERFGSLGNDRYIEYMKDIRGSGERVISIITDLNDLSRIETGKIDLTFTSQNLNEMVESCVAVMQPLANRERIIVRTSLAHTLPTVIADTRALRQITLNLIGNSIHLANAGGQVIVSTALSDYGDVVMRVRDTGHGLNDNELAAAMETFRTDPPSDKTTDSAGISLSLTKALVEANRAQFQIRTAPHSGTLIEVVFTRAVARA